MKRTGGRGFTIVELLIVVVVVALLAAIVIVSYNGAMNRATYSRAESELTSLAKAIRVFHSINDRYPADTSRGIPAEITPYINGSADNWPNAPWAGSVYDYDYFVGSDGNDAVQMSIRFCPEGGPLSACKFPPEPWAAGFNVNSSAYWCLLGVCKAHPSNPDNYPGYCMNCPHP